MTRMEFLMRELSELANNVAFAEKSGMNYDKNETLDDLKNLVEKIEKELNKEAV